MKKKKTILVTGGCGFIGTNLISYLINKKFNVINIDKLSKGSNLKYKKNKNVYFIKDNLLNDKNIYKILCKYKPEYLVHLKI